jgi:methyl-accepting chemotaxis protein
VSLASVNAAVVEINQHSVRALVSLADLRDMEGDMRVGVHDLLEAPAAERAEVVSAYRETDDQADADIAEYLSVHGTRTDPEGVAATDFVAKLAVWRQVRDREVVPAAMAGHLGAARDAVTGALATADDAMAEPLDDVFAKAKVAADDRVAVSQRAYDSARIWVSALITAGLALSALMAWLLIRRPVALLGEITDVVASGDVGARVGRSDGTDVGRLARSLDTLLGMIEQQRDDIATEQAARERQLAANFARQEIAEREVRGRAQSVIDETSRSVLAELTGVLEQAEAVRSASGEIDARVSDADSLTRAVVDRAGNTGEVVEAVTESLRRVAGASRRCHRSPSGWSAVPHAG